MSITKSPWDIEFAPAFRALQETASSGTLHESAPPSESLPQGSAPDGALSRKTLPTTKAKVNIFSITECHIVIHSVINAYNDTCAICKLHVEERCYICDTGGECNYVIGECNHAFHEHCITTWLKHKNTCPIDNNKFIIKLK